MKRKERRKEKRSRDTEWMSRCVNEWKGMKKKIEGRKRTELKLVKGIERTWRRKEKERVRIKRKVKEWTGERERNGSREWCWTFLFLFLCTDPDDKRERTLNLSFDRSPFFCLLFFLNSPLKDYLCFDENSWERKERKRKKESQTTREEDLLNENPGRIISRYNIHIPSSSPLKPLTIFMFPREWNERKNFPSTGLKFVMSLLSLLPKEASL